MGSPFFGELPNDLLDVNGARIKFNQGGLDRSVKFGDSGLLMFGVQGFGGSRCEDLWLSTYNSRSYPAATKGMK